MGKSLIFFTLAMVVPLIAYSLTPIERYDAADNSINGGDGYKYSNNETATLAWGESYIMMSYVSAYRAGNDNFYLDKLADHADNVLLNRDDARGVLDYRGISGACWQNKHYQPNEEPYCYAVHSGMISYPIAHFVKIVRDDPALQTQTTYDGSTYLAKADSYSAAIYETIAYHEDQWVNYGQAGYYTFRTDAAFLPYPGVDLPLNQGNALGRAILILGQAENDPLLLQRAEKMALWFEDQLFLAPWSEAYLWNYWGGPYSSPGEDISHAAINVDFAALCANAGIVFTDTDIQYFANTFTRKVYYSNEKLYDHVGGSGSDSTYAVQSGRWLRVSPFDATVYCAVRNLYDGMSTDTGSGSIVLGFANVASYDVPEQTEWYFTIDGWDDQGDYRVPTNDNAGIYFIPNKSGTMKLQFTYESDSLVRIRHVLEDSDEVIARFTAPDTGPQPLYFGYTPSATADPSGLGYGALFIISGATRVYEGAAVPVEPVFAGQPLTAATVGVPYIYEPNATGTLPIHFTGTLDGEDLQVDPLTGKIEYTFTQHGNYTIRIDAVNTAGATFQDFDVEVIEAAVDDDDDNDADDDDDINGDDDDDDVSDDDDDSAELSGDDDDEGESGCCG